MIVSASLNDGELCQSLSILNTNTKNIGYSIDDLQGMSHYFCMHKLHVEDVHRSSIQCQRCINPKMQERVKKKVVKVLEVRIF